MSHGVRCTCPACTAILLSDASVKERIALFKSWGMVCKTCKYFSTKGPVVSSCTHEEGLCGVVKPMEFCSRWRSKA